MGEACGSGGAGVDDGMSFMQQQSGRMPARRVRDLSWRLHRKAVAATTDANNAHATAPHECRAAVALGWRSGGSVTQKQRRESNGNGRRDGE